jgi:hypothetical protein
VFQFDQRNSDRSPASEDEEALPSLAASR